MLPIAPLMIEHRLIERMITVIRRERDYMMTSNKSNSSFLAVFVDFMKTYADHCHHGKEENILFRELNRKPLSVEHKNIMAELIEEHVLGRKITSHLLEAQKNYAEGDVQSLSVITNCLSSLVDFYPAHIKKEDEHFFLPIMSYFSQEEKNALLHEGFQFDQNLIHEKYREVVQGAESLHR